jgi:WD40 repeat protein
MPRTVFVLILLTAILSSCAPASLSQTPGAKATNFLPEVTYWPATISPTLMPAPPEPTSTHITLAPSPIQPTVFITSTRIGLTPTPTNIVYDPIDAMNFSQLRKIDEIRIPITTNMFGDYPNQFQLAFKNDRPQIISPSSGGVELADLNGNKQIFNLHDEGDIAPNIIVSPDYRLTAIVYSTQEKIKIWNLDFLNLEKTFPYLGREDWDLIGAFSQDNHYFAIAYCSNLRGYRDCLSTNVLVYDLETGEIILKLNGYQATVTGIGFVQDSKTIVMSGIGETLRNADLLVWDIAKNNRNFEASSPVEDRPLHLTVNNSGGLAITFPDIGDWITLWDVENWEMQGSIIANKTCCVRFLPNTEGVYIVASEDGRLYLGLGGKKAGTVATDLNFIINLFVSPDSKFVYVLDAGGLLQKWGISRWVHPIQP